MFELVAVLCGLAVVATLIGVTLVLPIVAFLRTRRIADLSARVARLERELAAGAVIATPVRPAEAAAPVEAIRVEPHAVSAEPAPGAEVIDVDARAEAPLAARDSGFDLETWIGRHGLGWVAVILLLFAVAFFLKYAFDNDWVGALGRVAIGILGGAALCVWGLIAHRRGWRLFSQMLSAGGVVLLYLTTFAAFGYYHLLPQSHAGIFLIALIAETFALAVLYDAPAIALMAVIGGLLAPPLLRTDHDQYLNLFLYLAALNTGVVGLTIFRSWGAVATVALLGTQALFWGWYQINYHPAKLAACLVFQTTLFALYLLSSVFAHVLQPRRATLEDLLRLVFNALLFAVIAYVLLDEDYHVVTGTGAALLAVVYTALTWFILQRRPDDERQLITVLSMALGFVAMILPLQAQSAWITVGWAVQGLALWWFGLRVRTRPLQAFGAALLMLAVALFLTDTADAGVRPLFVPIFNKYAMPGAIVAACLFAAARVTRHHLPHLEPGYRVLVHVIALCGVGVTFLLVSKETFDFCYAWFSAQPNRYDPWAYRAAQTSLSVIWAVYAVLLLTVGFRLRSGALRWSALGLFALTLGKVFLVDMAQLPGFYRVSAFFVLAVMMAAAAWGYQKFQQLADQREGGIR